MSHSNILHFRKDKKNLSLTKIAEEDILKWKMFHDKLSRNLPVQKGELQHMHDSVHIRHQWNRPLQKEYLEYTHQQKYAIAEQLMQIYKECERQQYFIDICLENIDVNTNQNIILRSIHFTLIQEEQAQSALREIFLSLGLEPNFSSYTVSQTELRHNIQPNKAQNVFREQITVSWKKNHSYNIPTVWKAEPKKLNLETDQKAHLSHTIQGNELPNSQVNTSINMKAESSPQLMESEGTKSLNFTSGIFSTQSKWDGNQTHRSSAISTKVQLSEVPIIEKIQEEMADGLKSHSHESVPIFQEAQGISNDKAITNPPSNFSFDSYNFFDEQNPKDIQKRAFSKEFLQPNDIFDLSDNAENHEPFHRTNTNQADPFDLSNISENPFDNTLVKEKEEKKEERPTPSLEEQHIVQDFEEKGPSVEDTETHHGGEVWSVPENALLSQSTENEPSYQMPASSNKLPFVAILICIAIIGLWMYPSGEDIQNSKITVHEKASHITKRTRNTDSEPIEVEQIRDSLAEDNLNIPSNLSLQKNDVFSKEDISTKKIRKEKKTSKKRTTQNLKANFSKEEIAQPSVEENINPAEKEILLQTNDISSDNEDTKENISMKEIPSEEQEEQNSTLENKRSREITKVSKDSITKKKNSEVNLEIILLQNLDRIMTASSIEDIDRNFIEVQKYIRQLPKHRYHEVQMLTSYKRASLLTNSIQMNAASDSQNIFELLMLWKEVERLARKYNQQDIINESLNSQQMLQKMLP